MNAIRLPVFVALLYVVSIFAITSGACAVRAAEDDFRLDGHESVVEQVCFSPDGKFVASGAQDKTARLWKLADKTAKVFTCEGRGTAFSVAFSPDGKFLAAGDFLLSVKLWSLPSGDEAANFEGDRKQGYVAQRVAFSPKSNLLVAGFSNGEIRAWDIATKTPAAPFKSMPAAVYALAFSPDGQRLAVGSWGSFKIFDVASRKELLQLLVEKDVKDTEIHALGWTPDGATLVSGDKSGFLRVWDAASGKKTGEFKLQLPTITSLAISPDGKTIATPWQNWDVAFVDLATLKIVKTLPGFEEEARSVCYSPDGQWLAASANNYIRVFKTSLAKPYVPK